MSEELYRKYRPTKFSEVLGQDDAIRTLTDLGRRKSIPHAILLSGPSGCGKTTLGRILRKKLGCSDTDFCEMNIGDLRGIDNVRSIASRMHLAPIGGKCRIWLIDEAHKLTSDAQDAFLKLLEDTPSHVYFMLATTDPQKLKRTSLTRCTEIKVKLLNNKTMASLLQQVLGEEGVEISEEVIEKIVDHAEGSARKALVLLNQVIGLEDEEKQLSAVAAGDTKAKAIELARALLNPRSSWSSVVKILKDVDEEPESLRYMVLGYCSTVLLGGGKMAGRAAKIIERFECNFYDSKKASLILACYDVITGDYS